jgi:hypothetical protein
MFLNTLEIETKNFILYLFIKLIQLKKDDSYLYNKYVKN